MTGQFIRITLSGSPEEIGLQDGKLLSEQIHQNIEFIKPITLSNLDDEAQVLQSAERIKEYIKAFNPNYITEIDHLALPAVLRWKCWTWRHHGGLFRAAIIFRRYGGARDPLKDGREDHQPDDLLEKRGG